jgi:hypothetical protein
MNMRKRGLIVLVATVPAWAVVIYLGWEFEKANRIWGYEGSPPPFLLGAVWAVILTTLAALGFLLRDFISWRRQRNDRTN